MPEIGEVLEQLRKEDIDFFAKRYAELYGEYFGKTTPEQIVEFGNEIRRNLNKNVSKYVIDNQNLGHNAAAISNQDKITLSDYNYKDKSVRIHELVHSYNYMESKRFGLRDLENDLVLRHIDEGSTEMIAQLMLGNSLLKNTNYYNEVMLTNFLTHLVGDKIMIQATRGNPKLLSQEVDKLLGTTDFLRKLEGIEDEHDKLVSQSFGVHWFWGTPIEKDIKILSGLKLEVNRENDIISLLYDAIQKTNNPELLRKFGEVDDEYGYNFRLQKSIRKTVEFNPNETTLASVMQEQLKQEIQKLSSGKNEPIDDLKIEIMKYLYDQIDFQRYFVDKNNYEYGMYKLSPEDTDYCRNFRSSIDGSNIRLGGQLGLVGIGNKVYELNNVIFKVNREYANRIIQSELGFDELLDKRLEIISEQLLIAQQQEILGQWKTFIKNSFLKERFPFLSDDVMNEMLGDLENELDSKEKHVIEKYKNSNLNGNIFSSDEKNGRRK